MSKVLSVNPAIAWAAKVITDKKYHSLSGNNRLKLSSSYLDVLGPMGDKEGVVANKLAEERRALLRITPEMVKQWKEADKVIRQGESFRAISL